MDHTPHIVLIGAGGVASYLLPVLLKAFKPSKITIYDKDMLEERNLDRQLFDPEMVGTNKATALLATISPNNPTHFEIIDEWFTQATKLPDGVDFIVCVADNHMARYAACLAAQDLGIRAYVGGNEYFDHEAFVYDPKHAGTRLDPLVRYPNIRTETRGSPTRCQGEEQEAHPQLAIANFGCAAKLLHLIHAHEVVAKDLPVSVRPSLPLEIATSIYDTVTINGNTSNV